MRVGWIGLGQMGAPMAHRVLAGGHALLGHSRRPRPDLLAAGASLTGSIEETAATAEVLCVCLFDDTQVRDVLIGQGALAALPPRAVVALHTTGAPALMDDLTVAAPDGVSILDAPFSGTAAQAATGRLTLLVGGETQAITRARPVLSAFASTILHVGPKGAGRGLKLINNLLFAAQISLADEALRAAALLGLERDGVARAIGHCSGASYAMAKFAGPTPHDPMLAAMKPYLDKDVDAARLALDGAGDALPLLTGAARWGTGKETA
ncbi:MAG: NAD(P)-binding domain-containing protein [Caulobacter sp.]|nr:NAD(P)-binding domain-containing protein [Caulobacter sp.]